MKVADIRTMTVDQIDDEVLKLKKEHFNLRFQRATGQLENTSRVRSIRRDVARLKTIAAQKRAGTQPDVKADSAPAPKPEKKAKTETKIAKPKAAAKPKKASRAKTKK